MKTNLIAAVLIVAVMFGVVVAQDTPQPNQPEPAPAAPPSPEPQPPEEVPGNPGDQPIPEGFVKTVEYDDHHASNDIWGDWIVDNDASPYFNTEHNDDRYKDIVFSFARDEAASKRIIEQMPTLYKKSAERDKDNAHNMARAMAEVYATGKISMVDGDRKRGAAFALVVYRGEPLILLLEGTDEKSFDWETIRYNFINDPNGDKDKLLLSGDMADESYSVFKRKS